MSKLVVSQSLTVDGFVDSEQFLPFNSDERNKYMAEIVFGSGNLLIGRTTYDPMVGFWSNQKNPMADKMNSMPKFVVSSTIPKVQWNNTTVIKENVVEEIAKLKHQSGQQILIIGSATLAQFLTRARLIDEYKLLVHPIIERKESAFSKKDLARTS